MDDKILIEIDIKNKLLELSRRGFIKSLRKDDTGIGFTIETLLGIKENNLGEADFVYNNSQVELKTQREHASSNITLITKSPYWEPLSAKQIIKKYGYKDVNGRIGLKVTLKTTNFNPQGLKLEINEKEGKINIIHNKDGVICYFLINEIMDKLKTKLSENLLVVFAKVKSEKGEEYFHYNKAIFLSKLSEQGFKKLLTEGFMVWEFRMHIKKSGSIRDHGAGFRLNKRHITKLYEKQEKIL